MNTANNSPVRALHSRLLIVDFYFEVSLKPFNSRG